MLKSHNVFGLVNISLISFFSCLVNCALIDIAFLLFDIIVSQELISEDLMDTKENNSMVEIVSGFSVFHEIYEKLYPYQREGIAWMWKLYKMGKGGVLGDDMG